MGNRRRVFGGVAVLVWVGTLVLHAATGIGWWVVAPAVAAAVLAALALPAPDRPGAWGARRRRDMRAALPSGPVPAGRAFPAPAGPPAGRAPTPGTGTVLHGDVGVVVGSVFTWADDAVVAGDGSGARYRPLIDYADDPLTPVAAETVTDGLERLFLRLGPPPGAARNPDRTAPTPRGDDR
ncbi:hypothetical protein ACGF0D_02995 [Kitasatospora sp. NPDC048298]|uniref:hypothetical protein n=1 Tax=Kitasatospora sp. NPDC048298 TaxID=3364049 RepID=UPI0037228D41